MRFFKPTPHFWDFADRFRGRSVIEIGCGDGDLVREMEMDGHRIMGVDPRFSLLDETIPADLSNRILPLGIEDAPELLASDSILLICRPCHTGFPEYVRANMSDHSALFYIGLNKNLDRDLGEFAKFAILIHQHAGEDGEAIYLIS